MTTIGYGDLNGDTLSKRIAIPIIIFGGIAMFTIITEEVLYYRTETDIDNLVSKNRKDVSDFLWRMSKTRKGMCLSEEIYVECETVIANALRYSTKACFSNEFWKTLPPQLQDRIVNSVLFIQQRKLRYFFNDY